MRCSLARGHCAARVSWNTGNWNSLWQYASNPRTWTFSASAKRTNSVFAQKDRNAILNSLTAHCSTSTMNTYRKGYQRSCDDFNDDRLSFVYRNRPYFIDANNSRMKWQRNTFPSSNNNRKRQRPTNDFQVRLFILYYWIVLLLQYY